MGEETKQVATTAGAMTELLRRTGLNALKDRSAMGILAETITRMAARDQEITRRLIGLGVRGEDEQEIFDRIAGQLEKLDAIAKSVGLTATSSVEQFKQNSAVRERRVAHAQEVLAAFSNVLHPGGHALPSEPSELRTLFKTLIGANDEALDRAVARMRGLEHGLESADAITNGLRQEIRGLKEENANLYVSLAHAESIRVEAEEKLAKLAAELNAIVCVRDALQAELNRASKRTRKGARR